MADLTDYTNLITSEHSDKPNFLAVLAATLQPFVDGQNQMNLVPSLIDVDVAVGDQLDKIGQWAGLSRALRVPITGVFFAFDTPGLGFDQGVWASSLTPTETVIQLDDGTYRLMLKAKIAANTWDGSLGDANAKLQAIFGAAAVQLRDNMDMSETFIISGTPPSVLFRQLVIQKYLDFKPAGVNVT